MELKIGSCYLLRSKWLGEEIGVIGSRASKYSRYLGVVKTDKPFFCFRYCRGLLQSFI